MTLNRQTLSDFVGEVGIVVGCAVVFCAVVAYGICGFHFTIWTAWLAGLAICGYRFFLVRAKQPERIRRLDIFTVLALFFVAIPTYLWSLYTIPYQVGSDEVVAISKELSYFKARIEDIFGLSDYYGFTSFHFLLQGWLANSLGGINLYNVRFVHAAAAVLIVPSSYVFFRVLGLRWLLSIAAALFVCFNHALVAISRMACITNFPLLIEICALSLLFDGLKRKCPFTTYLGGVAAGVGFYVYYPARIVMPLWLVFIFVLLLVQHGEEPASKLPKQLGTCILGLVLTILPLAVAHIRQSSFAVDAFEFQKRQCLLFPEGRELAKTWTPEKTIKAGITQNIRNGLTAFNNNISDYGWAYENPNHGFVDPLSGVLLWIGFFSVIIYLRTEPAAILMLSGFLFQLFSCAFIVTKAPNYSRLLITLPFVAYFVAQGIEAVSLLFRLTLTKLSANLTGDKFTRVCRNGVFLSAIFTIALWNAYIFNQFIIRGTTKGDPIGGTVRYVESKKGQPIQLFITAASAEFPYYAWELPSQWTSRVEPFLTGNQDCRAFTPEDLVSIQVVPPVSFFMNGDLWKSKQEQLFKMYPKLVVHKLYERTGLVAIEDATVAPDSARVHAAYKRWGDCLSRIEQLRMQQNHTEIERLCLTALKTPEALVNGSDFKARILLELGTAQANRKKFDEAEKTLLEAMKIREGLAGHKDYDTVCYAEALADFYANRQQWAKAENWFREVNKIRAAGEDAYSDALVPFYASTYRKIALVCWRQAKYEEAEKNYAKASNLYRRHPERNTWETAAIRSDLEMCHQDRIQHDRISSNH